MRRPVVVLGRHVLAGEHTVTIDEQEFQMIAFQGFLHFAAAELSEQFIAETGTRLGGSPLDRMIDKATGYDREVAERFIGWAATQYGEELLPHDYLERLRAESTR